MINTKIKAYIIKTEKYLIAENSKESALDKLQLITNLPNDVIDGLEVDTMTILPNVMGMVYDVYRIDFWTEER